MMLRLLLSSSSSNNAVASMMAQLVVQVTVVVVFLLVERSDAQEAPNPLYQIPAFSTPPATTNHNNRSTFRNDVCHLAARRGEDLELPEILRGVELHPLLMLGEFTNMDYEYDSNNNNTVINVTLNKDYPGLVPLLMDELCERAGCTWRNTYAAYGYDVLTENHSFDELALWSTEVFDVNLDWWMRSVSRLRQGITFTEKWYDASIILVAKKPNADDSSRGDGFDPFSWLYPFDNNVWYLTMATILFSAGVYWFLEYLNPNADSDEETSLEFGQVIWMFATAFTGQFEFDPNTHPARLFTFSIAFWALLMSAAYTANLASFLVVANTPQNPIESLGQAVRAGLPMCVWKSSQTDSSVSAAFPAYAGSGLLVRMDSQQQVFEGVQEIGGGVGSVCAIAITELSSWETFQYDASVNKPCNLQWIGRAFEFVPASFVMTTDAGDLCTSLLRAVFDLHLHDMEREGFIASLWEGHIEQTATVFCRGDDETSSSTPDRKRRLQEGRFRKLKAANNAAAEAGGDGDGDASFDDTTKLSLNNMGGVFLLHGVLSVMAVLCAMVSWHRDKSKKAAALLLLLLEEEEGGGGDVGQARKSAPRKDFISSRESVTSDSFFDAVEGGTSPAVEVLRAEMNSKLEAIDEKLERLLSVHQQQSQQQQQQRLAVIADQGMRLEYS
jgi:hypothetical protein